MPRIRDLGISVIPATMRPPEIGLGGGFDANAANAQIYLSCPDNSVCENVTHVPCDTSCTGSSGKEECDPPTHVDPCPGPTCANSCPGQSNRRDASGLNADVVLQLKRHLQDRIGTQLHH